MGIIPEETEKPDLDDLEEKEIIKQMLTRQFDRQLSDVADPTVRSRHVSGNFGAHDLTQSLLSDNSTNAPYVMQGDNSVYSSQDLKNIANKNHTEAPSSHRSGSEQD